MRSSLGKRLLLLCKHFFSFLQICIDAGHKDKMYRLKHGHKVQSGCMKERRPIQFLKCSIVLFKNAQISMHRWPYSVMQFTSTIPILSGGFLVADYRFMFLFCHRV